MFENMIYDYAKQIIAMLFLIAIVNFLVIPEAYKKMITFYLHFFIIVIILKPVLSIMGNEVSSYLDSFTFISEEGFNESVKYYQNQLGEDISEFTVADIDKLIRSAEETCQVEIYSFELEDVLIINSETITKENQYCLASEIGISISDIKFEGGGQ
ncbi:MAG TPA: hypothetical protein DCY20_04950 [Firmicutes bacterium]|nr:hypothetical protein [Bacillota bacterium]